jgi:glycerol-3-phosphate acyltransferase PlsY
MFLESRFLLQEKNAAGSRIPSHHPMMGLLSVFLAYLLGSIPFGYLLVKLKTGADVRATGSGNIGATNVFRTTGRGMGVFTLVLDALKAYAAVAIAARLTGGDEVWTSAAAVAVLLGHIFPVFLNFRGGKAVASFIGAYLYLAPIALLAVLAVFVVAVWRTKFISLGSVLAAGLFPLAVWMIMRPHWPLVVASVVSAALILWRHQGNIARLRQGTENAFNLSRAPLSRSRRRPA